jgi:hypothetical protein
MTHVINIRPLAALRGNVLPSHIKAALTTAPQRVAIEPWHHSTSITAQPDFSALYPLAAPFPDASGDLCTAANARLLYSGAELAFDAVKTSAGNGVFGYGLEIEDVGALAFEELEYVLPRVVVRWLKEHTADEATAWVAFFLAEIQLHAGMLAVGRFPDPHSTASEVALHLIIDGARDVLEAASASTFLDWEFDLLGVTSKHAETLEYLRMWLIPDDSVLTLYDPGTQESVLMSWGLHPSQWFETFTSAINPWIEVPHV